MKDRMETKLNQTLVFFINGKKICDDSIDPEWTLLYYLRNKLQLCGTKLGCAEGGCGACTVMVSKFDRKSKKTLHYAVNACLAPVCSMHGLAVTTVEGIGQIRTKLHPVQERIAKAHGSQCGFCTPGIVMSMYALLRSLSTERRPNMQDLEIAFQGNLCRCTGYRPIIEGYKTFTEEWEQSRLNALVNGGGGCGSNTPCQMGEQCCRNGGGGGPKACDQELFNREEFKPYDPTQEPIFPPELAIDSKYDSEYLRIKGSRVTWYRPLTLEQLLSLKQQHPEAKIINGNTEVGVETKFKNCFYSILIQTNQIEELTEVTLSGGQLKVGASVTLTDLENSLNRYINTLPEYETRIFKSIVKMLHLFAGKQIRNVGAVGGNIMTGSPISDLNPIFMAAECTLDVKSKENGCRNVIMDENFWTGYRKNTIRSDEVLISINIPLSCENQHFIAYKQSKRRDDDIAIVNAAFNLKLNENLVIDAMKIAFGGMAPCTILAKNTSNKLIGKKWQEETLHKAFDWLKDEIPLDAGAPGGLIEYRRALTLSFMFKFYLTICETLDVSLPATHKSGSKQFHSLPPHSSQYFSVVDKTQSKHDLVGRPIVHKSAMKQATGEAIYCDDIPKYPNELYLSLVLSTRAHAKILRVDTAKAMALPGVVAFYSAKDFHENPELNKFGPVQQDEEVFRRETVTAQGQVIGAVVAVDQLTAQRAAKLINIVYEDLQPLIITIQDAIKAESYFDKEPKEIIKGRPLEIMASAKNIVQGEIHIGGQEHFYLETQACLAVPKLEDDEIEIFSSTQHPTEIQHQAAHMLNIPNNRIVCRVKRLGGGFGGKESRASVLALPVVYAAHTLRKPVRCMLDRDEDIITSGQRHPFFGKYKVAFDDQQGGGGGGGKLLACDIEIYNNAGYSLDLSGAVMERAMFHVANAYYIENIRVRGFVCKTNIQSNTAFRGFGGPQGMLIGETIITHIAGKLKVNPDQIRKVNLIKEGELTHYNQPLTYCTLNRCWEECKQMAEYEPRKAQVEQFNRENRWKKRGITLVPTMFGIAFTTLFLNQAGALVLIYTDGSVLVSHGGNEMGQGIHTKMIQVASRALGVPPELIHISETSTDKVPNTSPTAASAGSDLNGMALLNACNIINERLKPIKNANPKASWRELVRLAYLQRVSLAASGFYRTPDIGYNMATNTGKAFNYFTFGVACSEVEIDCLTGDHQVVRSDVVMDLGESLNPAIDIGQIEGGFMQGYGLFTLEEMVVSPTGTIYSRGPGAYKLPGFTDIPAQFNVSLLKGAPNPRAVYSSKAVGEPPLFLASSVFFAIREAIKSARSDNDNVAGGGGWFKLHSPATAARIRMACQDSITDRFPETTEGSFIPWNVVL